MRIVYCINNISDIGAITSVTAQKASALSRLDCNQVWIVVTEDKAQRLCLDERVTVINLGIDYYGGNWNKSRVRQLIEMVFKQFVHRRRLADVIKSIKPDVIVSTEMLEKYIILSLPHRRSYVCVREVHKLCNYKSSFAETRYERILARLFEFIDYRIISRLYDGIVVLTEESRDLFFSRNTKVRVIPNPAPVNNHIVSSLDTKTVVSAGRLCKSKNFIGLINAFAKAQTKEPDWKLVIWGEGEEMGGLKAAIRRLGLLDSVFLKGFSKDLFSQFAESGIFAITSLSEGFSMVILEAMSCGLPVVAYDCPVGPRAIITDGLDGFLIPVGDEEMMAEKLVYLMAETSARKKMGAAAREKAETFNMEYIVHLWNDLFCTLIEQKISRNG